MRLLRRRRPALKPLGEAEAYARCHGQRSDEIMSVERLPARPPPEPAPVQPPSARGLTGESLREAFEQRLRSRAT